MLLAVQPRVKSVAGPRIKRCVECKPDASELQTEVRPEAAALTIKLDELDGERICGS